MLHGREAERSAIDELIAAARAGQSGILVLRGEPGIGKTALLEYAADRAAEMPVLRAEAAESEVTVPFAAVYSLLRPALHRIDRLPQPQAAALSGALGLAPPAQAQAPVSAPVSAAPVADKFVIGLAVLTLLAEFSAGGPVLCLVDDAQWLDEASADALLFAARRLDSEGVAMLISARDGDWPWNTAGLPCRWLDRLDAERSDALLAARTGPMTPQTRRQVLAEAEGNPLALLELSAALTAEQRAGGAGPLLFAAGATSPPSRVRDAFRARVGALPEPVREMLLVAAAADTPALAPVLAAAAKLGLGAEDLELAERAGLIRVSGQQVVFRHPLVRAAVYEDATYGRRVAVHRALAEALAGHEHADRRAWHLAAAAVCPDEQAAAELEKAGLRARGCQAMATASAAFERAARLTGDQRARLRLLVAAAQSALPAGHLARTADLAREAADAVASTGQVNADPDTGGVDPHTLIGLAKTRAVAEFEQGRPGRTGHLLVEAARRMAGHAPDEAVLLLSHAVRYASFGGDSGLARDARACLELAVAGTTTPEAGILSGMSSAVAGLVAGELDCDLTAVRTAVREVASAGGRAELELRLLAASSSLAIGDNSTAHRIAADMVAECRAYGMYGSLTQALVLLTQAQIARGRHNEARACGAEAYRLARELDQKHHGAHVAGALAWLAAARGDEAGCTETAHEAIEHGRVGGMVTSRAIGAAALGVLELNRGRPAGALGWLEQTRLHPVTALNYTGDLVEAAVFAGRPERAREPLTRLRRWADHSGRTTLKAVAERCAALLATGDRTQAHFESALRLHRAADHPFQQARTELHYGQWLRRSRRRGDARRHLHAALTAFERIGADGFAERARAELRSAGAPSGRRHEGTAERDDPLGMLTPQERKVVRLAASGATTREIAARLFLSPRTIEHHLYKAFPKLGVSSRAELAELVGDPMTQ